MVIGEVNDMDYYAVKLKYSNRNYYAIWYSDNNDGFITTNKNEIVLFDNLADIKKYSISHTIDVDCDNIACYNFDDLYEWCVSDSTIVDCDKILNDWNIISDFLNTLKITFVGDNTTDGLIQSLYNKLFYGNNLPTINTTNEKYIPSWSKHELKLLKDILKEGVTKVRAIFLCQSER